MALPTFVNAGSISSSQNAVQVGFPASIQVGDVLILPISHGNGTCTIADQAGGNWVEIESAVIEGGARLTVFWDRYNGTQTEPTTNDSGDNQAGRMLAFRGCVQSGNPWDVTATSTDATSDTSVNMAGATTTVNDCMILGIIATDLPDAAGTSNFGTPANADLANVTKRTDNTFTAGSGGGLGQYTGEKVTAGTFGEFTATLANAAVKAMRVIALKPAVIVPYPGWYGQRGGWF